MPMMIESKVNIAAGLAAMLLAVLACMLAPVAYAADGADDAAAELDAASKPEATEELSAEERKRAVNIKLNNRYLEELVVTGSKGIDPTVIEPETKKLFSIAGAADDPLQAIFALPGVTFGEDGEPVIRGSAPQDNAYYIDLIPAQYLFHVFGNSIFNKNLIRKFDLYPAAFPSQFSNATGGVIDVTLREPRDQPFTTTLNWSFLITGAMVETRVSENQAFYLSYRRSLLDVFANLLFGDETDEAADEEGFRIAKFPVSHDYQFKYNWYLSDQSSLSFVAAGAGDTLAAEVLENSEFVMRDPDLAGPLGFTDGFDSQGIIWEWQSQNADRRVQTTFSRIVNDSLFFFGGDQMFDIDAENFLARADYSQILAKRHEVSVGASRERRSYKNNIRFKFFTCTDFDPTCPGATLGATHVEVQNKIIVNVNSIFAQDIFHISERQQLTFGLHYFGDDFLKESRLEPRVRWLYNFTDNWKVSAAAGRYSQLPELEQIIPGVGNPNLRTIKANHFVAGVEQELGRGWSWKFDAYYKSLSDVVVGAEGDGVEDAEQRYDNDASGGIYGAEFVINKNRTGRWFGWVALSLSSSKRTNNRTGETTPFNYDRPVMLDLVLNYDLARRWRAGIKWSYYSGALYTPITELRPSGEFRPNSENPAIMDPILEPVYGDFNSQRYPNFHRLDFRLEFVSSDSRGHWSFYLDLINAYNAKIIQTYDYTLDRDNALATPPPGFGEDVPATAETSFGMFPSIGFELEF